MRARLLRIVPASFVLAGSLLASMVNYSPAPTTDTKWRRCGGAALAGKFCDTTAFFEPNSLANEFMNNPGGISVIFGAGFNAWNNNNNKSNNPAAVVGQGWSLSNGGDPGGAFNVTFAKALTFNGGASGGAEIILTPSTPLVDFLDSEVANDNANASPGKDDYMITWVQALYDNYENGTVPAFYEMDVKNYIPDMAVNDPSYCRSFPAGCPGPPRLYTFDDDPHFGYQPLGQPQGFFFGNAYIAVESLKNKSLTVYDGVDYGWHNMSPPPSRSRQPGHCWQSDCPCLAAWRAGAPLAAGFDNIGVKRVEFKVILAFFGLAGALPASMVDFMGPLPADTGWNACDTKKFPSLKGDVCRTVAYLELKSLDQEFMNNPGKISVIFGAAFNAWNNNDNKSNNPPAAMGQGWTLNFGGDPGGAFDITTFQAIQPAFGLGGAHIEITPDAALLKSMNAQLGKGDKLTWVQGVYLNWDFTADALPTFYAMDVNAGATDPSYSASFQPNTPPAFLDRPRTLYLPLGSVQDFFYANAYLAIENVANKTVTVYDGVDYGFNNYVAAPEPLTWPLLAMGLPLVGWLARRRNR